MGKRRDIEVQREVFDHTLELTICTNRYMCGDLCNSADKILQPRATIDDAVLSLPVLKNGYVPVSNLYKVTPRDQISLAGTVLRFSTSGA